MGPTLPVPTPIPTAFPPGVTPRQDLPVASGTVVVASECISVIINQLCPFPPQTSHRGKISTSRAVVRIYTSSALKTVKVSKYGQLRGKRGYGRVWYACVQTRTHVQSHARTRARAHARMHARTCVRMRVHTHTHRCVFSHICSYGISSDGQYSYGLYSHVAYIVMGPTPGAFSRSTVRR